MKGTIAFEKDGRFYLVGPVSPFEPTEGEIEEYAFAKPLLEQAPNPKLMWLRGQYVEADNPNENGHMWTASELGISSVTPTFMPVTVMHDPRTAVGLIADAKLLTPEKDNVQRARIDTTLALWKHRFPEVCAEAEKNYEAGSLMQSMECLPAYYDCGECGRRFPRLPGKAERANWCEHLREESAAAVRILGNTTFTGTGLIFGSRGARGAFSEAHLEIVQDEIAEFHEAAQHRDTPAKPKRKPNHMEISDKDYQELSQKAAQAEQLQSRVTELEETAAKVPDLEKQVETVEAAKVAAEGERDTLKGEKEQLEETARTQELSSKRLGALGKGFTEKLGEITRGRLNDQAGTLSEEDWEARLQELEELASVKRDEGAKPGEGDEKPGEGEVTEEEVARSQLGGGSDAGGDGGEPAPAARRSVVGGLVEKVK